MKKFLNILLVGLLIVATALACVGCTSNGGNGSDDRSGLLLKKIEDVYTIYDYVAVEGETTLDIGAVLTEKGIDEQVKIKKGAFDGVSNLTKIIVPSNVVEIAEGAFRNVSGLETLELPFIGKNVNSDAFLKESAKGEVKSVDKERTIAHLFGTEKYDGGRQVTINYGASTVSCYMPVTFENVIINANSVSEGKTHYSIPMYAFNGATNLKTVELKGEKLGAIGEGAFGGCTALKNVQIPATVKVAYDKAFSGCSKLESVILNGEIQLKDDVFSGCKSIKYVGKKQDLYPEIQTVDLEFVTALGEGTFDFANEYVTYKVLNVGTLLNVGDAFGETKFTI